MKYRCVNCKYKFETKLGKVPTKCPYCDSSNIRKDESAQELLEQISANDRL